MRHGSGNLETAEPEPFVRAHVVSYHIALGLRKKKYRYIGKGRKRVLCGVVSLSRRLEEVSMSLGNLELDLHDDLCVLNARWIIFQHVSRMLYTALSAENFVDYSLAVSICALFDSDGLENSYPHPRPS
mmetsp:Transcript_4474/g.6247  ORF Transcript_4474/g.6247 Transcript_4474/m.6247 type:complete len:129 (-) Transcript_4474:162-548(-)